jgi:arsenate reductase
MAEGFARHIGSDFIEAYSAGTHHSGVMSEHTIAAMEEKGIDISRQYSKGLSDVPFMEMDYVVTLGCRPADQLCPVDYPGEKIDWAIEDPIGHSSTIFREVRENIESRVTELLEAIWKNQKSESS